MSVYEKTELNAEQRLQLCSKLSHQFIGPLNTILSGTEYIQASLQKGNAEQQQQAVELSAHAIQDSVRCLDRLSQNLLDLLQIFSGGLCPNCTPMELCRPMERLLILCRPYAARNEIALEWDPAELAQEIYVCADASLVDRILLNLLSNAIRYGRPGGWVRVCLTDRENQLLITVQDNGAGLSPQEGKRAFEPFGTAEIQPGQQGQSLGLYLVEQFCRAMGWSVRLDGGPQGTLVQITAPMGKGPDRPLTLCSGALQQEIRNGEQERRVLREMEALFGAEK